MRKGKFVFGTIFVLIGLFLLLNNFSLIGFSFWKGISMFWPVGLIFGGVCLLLRQRILALICVIFTISLLVVSSVEVGSGNYLENSEKFVKVVNFSGEEKFINFDLEFGAGSFTLKGDDNLDVLGKFEIESFMPNEVDKLISYEYVGDETNILVSRDNSFRDDKVLSIFNFDKKGVDIDSVLSSKVPMDLDLEYGAAEIRIDLSSLMVDNMKMDFGASDTTIKFAEYPTKVDINTGASSIDLEFVNGYPVLVEIDGGLVDVDLYGFTKTGSIYKSENFKYDDDYIYININAGASSINGGFVE